MARCRHRPAIHGGVTRQRGCAVRRRPQCLAGHTSEATSATLTLDARAGRMAARGTSRTLDRKIKPKRLCQAQLFYCTTATGHRSLYIQHI